MPYDSYHGHDRRALGRRVMHLHPDERLQVSCERCDRTRTWDWGIFKHFRHDCPISFFEEEMAPTCWRLTEKRPADCQRKVVWLDASPEDGGCSDEG